MSDELRRQDNHQNEKAVRMSDLNSDGTVSELIKKTKVIPKYHMTTRQVKICVCGCSLGNHTTSKINQCNICNCMKFVLHHVESFGNRVKGRLYNIVREYHDEDRRLPTQIRNSQYKYCTCGHAMNYHRLQVVKKVKVYFECEHPNCNGCEKYVSE